MAEQPTAEQDVFPQQGFQPSATPADFGAQIGAAKEAFGQQTEQSGEILGQAALRRQQLINEAHAQDSDIRFQTDLAGLEENYYQLSGKQAADALPSFQANVQALRQQYLAGAPNPVVQEMLGQSLQFSTVRTLLTAGRYAGEQTKSWIVNSGDARAAMLAQQVGRNYADQTFYDAAIGGIKGAAANVGATMGWDQDQIDLYAQKYIDEANKQRQTQAEAAFNALPITTRIMGLAGGDGQPGAVGGSEYHALTATIESGGNAGIGTNATGHTGLFQASDAWWQQFGGGGDINNADDQHKALDRETAYNLPKLKADLGRPVTNADLYLAHQQGEAGAVALLNNPDKLASEVVPLANISGNLPANSPLDPEAITARQFTNLWAKPYQDMDAHALQPNADPQLSKAQAIAAVLPPDVRQKLTKQALTDWTSQADALYTQQQHAEKQAKDIAERNRDAAVTGYQQTMLQHENDPTTPALDLVAMSKDPALQPFPDAVRGLVAFQRALDRPDPVAPAESAKVTQATFLRLGLPEGDPNKITSMQQINDIFAPPDGSKGAISKADRDWLAKQFTDGQTADGQRLLSVQSEFLKSAQKMIDPTAPGVGASPFAAMRYYAFSQAVAAKVQEFRAAGKDPAKLFDPTPGNKDYVGSPGFMHPYTRSLTDIMTEATSGAETQSEAETPAGVKTAGPAAKGAVPADLPKGTTYYGQTKDGRPVYLMPNGTKVSPGAAPAPEAAPAPPTASTAPTVPLAP